MSYPPYALSGWRPDTDPLRQALIYMGWAYGRTADVMTHLQERLRDLEGEVSKHTATGKDRKRLKQQRFNTKKTIDICHEELAVLSKGMGDVQARLAAIESYYYSTHPHSHPQSYTYCPVPWPVMLPASPFYPMSVAGASQVDAVSEYSAGSSWVYPPPGVVAGVVSGWQTPISDGCPLTPMYSAATSFSQMPPNGQDSADCSRPDLQMAADKMTDGRSIEETEQTTAAVSIAADQSSEKSAQKQDKQDDQPTKQAEPVVIGKKEQKCNEKEEGPSDSSFLVKNGIFDSCQTI